MDLGRNPMTPFLDFDLMRRTPRSHQLVMGVCSTDATQQDSQAAGLTWQLIRDTKESMSV
jgi:hypothetical protein